MKNDKLIKVECPGCGKELHSYTVPSTPGTYRLMCKSDRTKQILLKVDNDGFVNLVKENREK